MLTSLKKPITSLFGKFPKFYASDLTKSSSSGSVVKREKLQFSKSRLTDFGELPQGEIPDALQYDHPFGNLYFLLKENFLFYLRNIKT